HVAANRAPTRDLTQIVLVATPAIVTAIPLEPAARIVCVNPPFSPPFRERLRRVHAEIIQRRAPAIRRKLRPRKPVRRKLFPAIGHIFSTEHSKFEHLFRCQLWREAEAECEPDWFRAEINIIL